MSLTDMEEQTIELPLKPGSHVLLYRDIDMGEEGETLIATMYEARVERYVPDTGLLEMSDGTGRTEFLSMVEEAVGYEIIESK